MSSRPDWAIRGHCQCQTKHRRKRSCRQDLVPETPVRRWFGSKLWRQLVTAQNDGSNIDPRRRRSRGLGPLASPQGAALAPRARASTAIKQKGRTRSFPRGLSVELGMVPQRLQALTHTDLGPIGVGSSVGGAFVYHATPWVPSPAPLKQEE